MNTNVSFLSPVQEDINAVEELMRSQARENHTDLKAALDVLLSSGGKRVRPSMTLLFGRLFNIDRERMVTMAAAIEMLHTATLVHDDLIDNSLLRRGIPTLNAQWSPGATVLTGDFLFARAAQLAADADSISVMKLFSRTLTTIVNGEIGQLFTSRCQPSRDDYYHRIYAKTASLFETATLSAALLGEASPGMTESIRCFGYETGMAFQIVDDIFDFTSDAVHLGKPIGNDLRQGLITLPALYFFEDHPDDPDVLNILNGNCPGEESVLQRLVNKIRSSPTIDKAYAEARACVERAIDSLNQLPSWPEQESLREMANYIVARNN